MFVGESSSPSVEVVARDFLYPGEGPEPFSPEREGSIRVLKPPFDDERAGADDHGPVIAEEIGADDRLAHPRLVLEGQEDEPLCRTGPLADDDRARRPDPLAVGTSPELLRREDPLRPQHRAPVLDQVRTRRHLRCPVIGGGLFGRSHLGERRRIVGREGLEERTRRASDLGDLPERGAPRTAEPCERSRLRQARQLVGTQAAAAGEIVHALEGGLFLLGLDVAPRRLAKPVYEPQPEADPSLFPAASPSRACDVDRTDLGPVPLRVLDEGGRVVEAHGPRVQQSGEKCGGMAGLQITARVGDQGKARGVRLGKPIQREGGDGLDDLVLGRSLDPALRHPRTQARLDGGHLVHRALEPHRPPQLLRLPSREAGRDHRDPQELFLEERDAQCPLQDRLERGVGILHGRQAAPAVEEGMDHPPDDGAGPDDRDLHDDVVEGLRGVARKRGHLCPALDLEGPHGVRFVQHPVDLGVVLGEMGEVHFDLLVIADHGDRLLDGGEHPQAEQVHLDDPEVGAVVLVPLDDDPPRHRGRLERDDLVEAARGDDHPSRVLAEVARQVLDREEEPEEMGRPDVPRIETRRRDLAGELREGVTDLSEAPAPELFGKPVHLLGRVAERLADLASRRAIPVGDDVGRHAGAVRAVLLVDVLDDFLTLVSGGQVEIDVGPLPLSSERNRSKRSSIRTGSTAVIERA